jgi:tryptophan-rich sensory protein
MLLHARGARKRGRLLALFVIGIILNFAWSPIFFRFHQVTAALVVIAAMIVITIVLAHRLWSIRKLAAAMMLVYLGWLMFAAALNEEVLRLNPNAEAVAPTGSGTNIAL